MCLVANLMVSLYFATFPWPGAFYSFLFGIFLYFILNLIPHFSLPIRKNFFTALYFVLDIIFGISIFLISFLIVNGENLSFLTKNVTLTFEGWFVMLGNVTVYIFFMFAELLPDDGVSKELLYFKRFFENVDNSIWGFLLSIALPIVSLSVMLKYIDFGMFWNR